VLRSTEELSVLLEDMGLNLQSMMASPHVKPFLEEVRAWEQRLSTIGECSAMWMVVQRKWMYLESIFVGSDDIRQQLPAEAKRFDGVDKAWLKIMAETAKNTNVLEACRWVRRSTASCARLLEYYLGVKCRGLTMQVGA
jgi:dynein heavy chain